MIIPPRLQPGDTIGIVTASTPLSQAPSPDPVADLKRGMAFLKDSRNLNQSASHHLLKHATAPASFQESRPDEGRLSFSCVTERLSAHGICGYYFLPLEPDPYSLKMARPPLRSEP